MLEWLVSTHWCYEEAKGLFVIIVMLPKLAKTKIVALPKVPRQAHQVTCVFSSHKTPQTTLMSMLLYFSVLLSTLYILPVVFTMACYVYEFFHLPDWMIQWQEAVCRHPDLSSRCHRYKT
jgi:hypothetical protein